MTTDPAVISFGSQHRPLPLLTEQIARIAVADKKLHAWAYLIDADHIKLPALESNLQGVLAGIPFGVKDVIDVAGMPTRYGSACINSAPAQSDATCVKLLRQAGAIPIGKTTTAEFAFRKPPSTQNPNAPGHSPGGSSSGSGAAVAASMVPFALSTQTGGSIIRPAAYCGIFGFKPTFGSIPRDGLGPGCESLDTIGWHGASLAYVRQAANVLLPESLHDINGPRSLLGARITVAGAPPNVQLEQSVFDNLHEASRRLGDHGAVVHVQTVHEINELNKLAHAHETIMHYELSRSLAPLVRCHDYVSQPVQDLLAAGLQISDHEYQNMLLLQEVSRAQWHEISQGADYILAPSTVDTPPQGLHYTGSSVCNRVWTLLGWPCLHLPWGKAPSGLPIGLQLIGQWQQDAALLSFSELVWNALQHSTRRDK